jgi:hypothetical protein
MGEHFARLWPPRIQKFVLNIQFLKVAHMVRKCEISKIGMCVIHATFPAITFLLIRES